MQAEEAGARKKALRQAIDQQVSRLTTEAVENASLAVCRRLLDLSCIHEADWVALYAAFGKEVDLGDLAVELSDEGTHLCYPRFDRQRGVYEMVAVRDPMCDLRPGHWGLLEPLPELPAISDDIRRFETTWLVPGCAFDTEGHRLGRGGGYYDRLLADVRGMRIGIALQTQMVDSIPLESHDATMNIVVTNQQTYVC